MPVSSRIGGECSAQPSCVTSVKSAQIGHSCLRSRSIRCAMPQTALKVPGPVIFPSASRSGDPQEQRTLIGKWLEWATLADWRSTWGIHPASTPRGQGTQAHGRTLGTQNRRPPRCLAFPGSSLSVLCSLAK